MSRGEMSARGWDALDVLLVTGDAYVDHPAFGVALIARSLEAAGCRVGIVAQPRWDRVDDLVALGPPRLFVGVTAGNLDSMLNKLTAQKKPRSLDAYSPDGKPGQRPNRASIVYAQLCRQAFPGIPVVLGGIEASLRRIAHYDFWSDAVRRSIVLDAKADLLVFGMAELTVLSIVAHLRAGNTLATLKNLSGTAYALPHRRLWETLLAERRSAKVTDGGLVELPSFEDVVASRAAFARMTHLLELETNPHNARALVQPHGNEAVYLNPPSPPLSTQQYDALHDLPFQRRPHPRYDGQRIAAYETVKCSVATLRGCYGGCSFCSIAQHEGRIVQSRSAANVVNEIERVANTEGFGGTITDVGGPTANMYRTGCSDPKLQGSCRRPSCLYPQHCRHLNTDHSDYISLLRRARRTNRVRNVYVASGIRYDLANRSPEFIEELAAHHVGGQLSVAPEHVSLRTLGAMRKPAIASYEQFASRFGHASRAAGVEQYLVPYFVVGHPGTTLADAVDLALYLKQHGLRPRQVQEFIPTPMTIATAMYFTGLDPTTNQAVAVVRHPRERRLQKALALYYDPNQANYVREALSLVGRTDLIGTRPSCLVAPQVASSNRTLRGAASGVASESGRPSKRGAYRCR